MSESIHALRTEKTALEAEQANQPIRIGTRRALLEVVAVIVASAAGLVLGGLTGWLPLSPILGMVLALLVATLFLRREGRRWRDLGFPKRMSVGRFIGYTLAAIVLTMLVTSLVVGTLLSAMNVPPPDISLLTDSIEGNTTNYIVFMVFVVWGSAAFGEELIARGFILDRISKTSGIYVAVFVQAAIFGLAHSYQGLAGVMPIVALALVFGCVYVRAGYNLGPLIAAHGIIDTIAITMIYLGHSDLISG
jgi:CAAX protease family protein